MAKKGSLGSKKGLNSIVWLVGGLSVAGFFAYQTNVGGFKDTISKTFTQLQQTLSTVFPGSLLIKSQTSTQQQQYPFNYPYPPTQQPQYAGPTTQSAAHYQMGGTPNIGIQGAGLLPNPNLWVPQGGITSNRVADPYAAINYGPYSATPTQFANQYYNIQGTNLQQPFIQGPIAPSPCPAGEYRAGDGRCYPLPSPPPEACPDGAYRASDGKCYAMVPGMPVGDCPGGYVKGSDGVCRQSIVCPPGYNYVDGVCKSTTTTPPPVTPPPVPIPPVIISGIPPITPLTVFSHIYIYINDAPHGTPAAAMNDAVVMRDSSTPQGIYSKYGFRTKWVSVGIRKPQVIQKGYRYTIIAEPINLQEYQKIISSSGVYQPFYGLLRSPHLLSGWNALENFVYFPPTTVGGFYGSVTTPNYSFFGASNPRRRKRFN